ncbi:hypothetical protein J2Z21_002962 [Streptomyces griseochromogenes]|uniref:Uncharacterized protein n=1 Tax=Streptomyces griseochromogenes TaxID=68214 RepID=A0A1B1AXH5_9ACTN|nr:hypothetical protein [Streptomyces griseochromogenes]ANP51284.1 hypothetical protein AVL59_18120 [Streptomyces griseochromogenes]MBP2050026.1 hypothetical protein [Streptomyces griseochromogenes]
MTTLLESRYRSVLRLLPAYYRREREEEMVETYLWDLDRDEQDQSRPTVGEVASIAALAVRSRLGAPGAPRRYLLLGSAVRLFALFAVLIQAAAAVVDLVLEVTWAVSRGGAERHLFLSQFTGRGFPMGVVTAALWILPLLWTVAYFALLHDRRGLARASALLAAVPNLWPLIGPLTGALVAPDPAFATTFGLLAWLPALALCAAHHRDAPPARLPVGSPGLVFMAACVLAGASVVMLPAAPDLAWAPASCFVVGALGWLFWQARGSEAATPGAGLALAALGLLILAVRVAAVYPWLHVPMVGVYLGGALVQTAALGLLIVALAVVGRRDLVAAEPSLTRGDVT